MRTKEGFIGKIVNENNDAFLLDKRIRPYESTIRDFCIFKDNIEFYEITKHSSNIIDLIEVGDYINGSRVDSIEEGFITTEFCENLSVTRLEYEIKSVVTKEQFKQIEYEV